eukprot:GHVP01063026.1.p1 GENE.GHVP01063026.1~~GHVP01063026.1.p1  ORF type:complete len:449 (+),score=71.65 GHVP01063026.1:114-1460(+)
MITTILGSVKADGEEGDEIEKNINKVRDAAIILVSQVKTKLIAEADSLIASKTGITTGYKDKLKAYATKRCIRIRVMVRRIPIRCKDNTRETNKELEAYGANNNVEPTKITETLEAIKTELEKIKTTITTVQSIHLLVTGAEQLAKNIPATDVKTKATELQTAKTELKKSTEEGVEHIQTFIRQLVREWSIIQKDGDNNIKTILELILGLEQKNSKVSVGKIIETKIIIKEDIPKIEGWLVQNNNDVVTIDDFKKIGTLIANNILQTGSVAAEHSINEISKENDATQVEVVSKKVRELCKWVKIFKEIEILSSSMSKYYTAIKTGGDTENKIWKKQIRGTDITTDKITEMVNDTCNDILEDEGIDEQASDELINIMRAVFENKREKLRICDNELIKRIKGVPTAADSTKSETKGEGMSRTTQVLIGVGITAGVIIIAFFIIRGRHHLT